MGIFLSIADGETPQLSLIVEKLNLFWRYLVAHFLAYTATVVGFILLIVPGIILMICFLFYSLIIVDEDLGPIEAIKKSFALTDGHRWKLFLLGLSVFGAMLLAAIPVFIASAVVGVGTHFVGHLSVETSATIAVVITQIVIGPISFLALVHAYRQLTASKEER